MTPTTPVNGYGKGSRGTKAHSSQDGCGPSWPCGCICHGPHQGETFRQQWCAVDLEPWPCRTYVRDEAIHAARFGPRR